ncbi:MAG: S8 family peptidase [Isosphaeraceae bacterium]
MPGAHQFEHLPLVRREDGPARYPRPRFVESPLTKTNRTDRGVHSTKLGGQVGAVTTNWKTKRDARTDAGLPAIDKGIPLLLQIDPTLDIDDLRHFFGFEIISEQDDGFVIVASEDESLAYFQQKLTEFIGTVGGPIKGSAGIAKIHELREDLTSEERLQRILNERLFAELPQLDTGAPYVVDVSISCQGNWILPRKPKRGRRTDKTWAKKEADWSQARNKAYEQWDRLKDERLGTVEHFIEFYHGEITGDAAPNSDVPPDYFELRARLPGRGLKDLILNHPYIFEVAEPDDIELPQQHARQLRDILTRLTIAPPAQTAPAVCVIDSGIQEAHILLEPAIDKDSSRCFLPNTSATDVADYVHNGGHGTRIAGAVLYADNIPEEGTVDSQTWVQNARVLNADCKLPEEVLPPALLREVIQHFQNGHRKTRIFNHSINADTPCRTKHMSAWAAEIDRLCNEHDILVIQSIGNLQSSSAAPKAGVAELLSSGKAYPDYLNEQSCRLSNPAQSLQALTVGSVGYGMYEHDEWRSFASRAGEPSAFSRSGLGIWGSIKPEVVEFGGDFLRTPGNTPSVSAPSHAKECYPPLVRSTLHGGPAYDRDDVGTSYAAPKVTRIAARLQAVLPEESCLLYRALIVQSARWPDWAKDKTPEEQTALIARIGYGVPGIERASANSDYRTTLITKGEQEIKPGGCHVYQVPIPEAIRRAGEDYNILVEVTLSYAAEPRRTRRTHRGYLSTWLDWMSNRKEERLESFISRAVRDEDPAVREGASFGWTISSRSSDGQIADVRRSIGTVQKDWAYIRSNALPEDFCIAVRGHKGWSKDPDNTASYTLAVTFESVGQEIAIYDPLRVAVQELQTELGIGELEAEAEIDIED